MQVRFIMSHCEYTLCMYCIVSYEYLYFHIAPHSGGRVSEYLSMTDEMNKRGLAYTCRR